jgi:RHO1 GDP-GTP exchange protein 1/2
MGRTLVCIVKSSPLSSTIKVMDPVEAQTKKKPQGAAFSKLIPTKTETLRVFKEFYIPTESTSIHFLKTKLCVGCTKGFEIVDLETLDTQGLLDPADPNLDLVHKPRKPMEQPLVRPIAIYRIEGDFLLCYDEFAFYVNRNGWRVGGPRNRDDVRWRITWEGTPTHFGE